MNRPIRRVAVLAMIMFALLLVNGTYSAVFRTDSLNADPRNRRVRDAEFGQDRGAILVGGTSIALTKPVDDRFRYQRSYPQGELYAPVTGYYSYDHARTGLEATFNTQLAGTDDSLFVRRMIDVITNRTPQGASVQTTLDAKAQEAAAKALGDNHGAVVAIDPRTGAILAMVTNPSYDPNKIASHDIGAAEDAYQDLVKDKDQPLTNRAAREVYPPGSTFKLVTAAAALEAGGKNADSKVESPNRLKLPNTNIFLGNDTNCGGTKITIEQALRVSCNTAFANLGLELGADALRTQAEKFGFDRAQLTELNGVASRFPDNPDLPQTALSAIGQYDVASTPLQMAMVSAAVANNGVLMKPYVVSEVRTANLQSVYTARADELSRPLSTANAQVMQQMMVGVVANGTGRNAQISGVTVGGKTGTAQSDPNRKPFAWFTSYAQSGDQSVAVAVVIEDADIARNDIAGGRLAAPVAKAVMEAVLT